MWWVSKENTKYEIYLMPSLLKRSVSMLQSFLTYGWDWIGVDGSEIVHSKLIMFRHFPGSSVLYWDRSVESSSQVGPRSGLLLGELT